MWTVSLDQWGHYEKEQELFEFVNLLDDTDSTEECRDSSSASSSSPSLSMSELCCDEDYVSPNYSPPRGNGRFADYSVDPITLGESTGHHCTHPESRADRQGGRVEGTRHSGQQRIQENRPYRRPQWAPTLAAPHNDQPYFDPESFHGPSGLDSGYQSSSSFNGQFDACVDAPVLCTPSSPAEAALLPIAFLGLHGFPDAGDHLRKTVGILPDVPISLWAVTDPPNGERPHLPLPMLIQLAIYGSEQKSLTLQEIYRAIATRFKYFSIQDSMGIESWRNSIRHALSLYSVFIKLPRPPQGRGCRWVLNPVACVHGPYGRERKRNNRPKGKGDQEENTKKRARATKPKLTNRTARRDLDDSSDSSSAFDLDERNLDPVLLAEAPFSMSTRDNDASDSATRVAIESRPRSWASSRRRTRPSPLK
ncbi:hypothetical protein K438DRAFT_420495 [Mycena galopus ATCC 62051]|nr:hypothetical protein K438DRAFT_420495 [Mycena galopus ATCC 62051]